MKHSRFRFAAALLLLCYCAAILWYTVLSRPVGFYTAHTALFWSYREWLGGDRRIGVQILANIALFVPFGLLLSACIEKDALWPSLLAGLLLSCLVEGLQYGLLRGQFEWDDLLHNSLGALLGGWVWLLLRRYRPHAALGLGLLAVVIAVPLSLCTSSAAPDYPERHYCFQLDSIAAEGDRVELRGFGFRYGHRAQTARLLAVSTRTGARIPFELQYGLEREDAARYFEGEDCARSGFFARASGLDPEEEYELHAAFGWRTPLPTRVRLRGGALLYAPGALFRAPEAAGSELDALLAGAVLRDYLPGLPCWIYQRGTTLYWIVSESYPFEADGSTRFQYGVWSTRQENLPQEKLHRELGCADLSAAFEAYELAGDFGAYRVMARELPEEYPVTAILTGYWSREGWSWKCCFRPLYPAA